MILKKHIDYGVRNKNQTFQYIKALLIVMVVDDHCGQKLGVMNSLFPYNSFYVPMFIFVSGYFFNEENPVEKNIKRACRKVLMPYLIWSFVGWIISFFLRNCGIQWWQTIDLKKLIELFFLNPLSSINGPMWYAIMYFWVLVLYSIICKIVKLESIKNQIFLQLFFLILGVLTVFLCRKGILNYHFEMFNYRLFIARTLFYLPFFQFGHIFHKYLETLLIKKNEVGVWVILICIVINIVLKLFYGVDIIFPATAGMSGFKSSWLPFVTSFTGILFWYLIMYGLSNTFGNLAIIDFIANNTFTIMAIHLLFADIPAFFLYKEVLKGKSVQFFDVQAFIGSAWYRYYDNKFLYFSLICGLVGSLAVAFLIFEWKKQMERFSKKKISEK